VPKGDGLLRDRPSFSAFPFIRFSRRIFRSTIGRWRSLPTRRSALRRLTRAVRFIKGWEALRLGRPLFVPERLMNDRTLSWPKELANYGALSLEPKNLEAISEYLPEHGRADLARPTF